MLLHPYKDYNMSWLGSKVTQCVITMIGNYQHSLKIGPILLIPLHHPQN